ncbi:MAG: hypothetical protein U5J82_13155 [Desulfobacterales bacterium]|nr:hypothetical protein [Desulfobacterales bacterium]
MILIEDSRRDSRPVRGVVRPSSRKVKYSKDIEAAIGALRDFMAARSDLALPYNPRWTAVKLLEDDKIIKQAC